MKQRLAYLDSIRGLAAVIVMLFHIWSAESIPFEGNFFTSFNNFPGFLHYSIDKLLPGRAAVMLFFVLSGFVLTYSLELKPTGYISFIIKRVFRIYPAFLCVVLICYALHCWIGARVGLPNHLYNDDMLQVDTKITSLLRVIFMFGFLHDDRINGVIWSLIPEMRASFLFPLILFTTYRGGVKSLFVYAAISIISTALSYHFTGKISIGNQEETMFASLLASAYFLIYFAAGAYLCIKRDIVADKISRLSNTKIILLLMLSAALFMKSDNSTKLVIVVLSDYLCGIAALILISVALGAKRFQRILNHKIPVWLGRISYTLYLMHVPVSYLLTQTLGIKFSGYLVALSVIVLSLISAELLTRFVELPMNRFGKKLAALQETG